MHLLNDLDLKAPPDLFKSYQNFDDFLCASAVFKPSKTCAQCVCQKLNPSRALITKVGESKEFFYQDQVVKVVGDDFMKGNDVKLQLQVKDGSDRADPVFETKLLSDLFYETHGRCDDDDTCHTSPLQDFINHAVPMKKVQTLRDNILGQHYSRFGVDTTITSFVKFIGSCLGWGCWGRILFKCMECCIHPEIMDFVFNESFIFDRHASYRTDWDRWVKPKSLEIENRTGMMTGVVGKNDETDDATNSKFHSGKPGGDNPVSGLPRLLGMKVVTQSSANDQNKFVGDNQLEEKGEVLMQKGLKQMRADLKQRYAKLQRKLKKDNFELKRRNGEYDSQIENIQSDIRNLESVLRYWTVIKDHGTTSRKKIQKKSFQTGDFVRHIHEDWMEGQITKKWTRHTFVVEYTNKDGKKDKQFFPDHDLEHSTIQVQKIAAEFDDFPRSRLLFAAKEDMEKTQDQIERLRLVKTSEQARQAYKKKGTVVIKGKNITKEDAKIILGKDDGEFSHGLEYIPTPFFFNPTVTALYQKFDVEVLQFAKTILGNSRKIRSKKIMEKVLIVLFYVWLIIINLLSQITQLIFLAGLPVMPFYIWTCY